MAEHGELDAEVTYRVQSGWNNWKRISRVLCDRNMNVKIKGKVYRTVVRPAMVYGAEPWTLKKAHANELDVAQTRMLRWSCGVTKQGIYKKLKKKRDSESGGNHKESPGKGIDVVWACDEKRGTLRRKEGVGNESAGEREERKT